MTCMAQIPVSSARTHPSLLSSASFSERVRNMSPDEIKIPPEPPGRCSNQLQVGISPFHLLFF